MLLSKSVPPMARDPRRKGLTLIELIVVLMILIALAGLLAPMLPSMLTRAHTSTCSTNIVSTAQAIQQYNTLYSQYPNNWDSLVGTTGTGGTSSSGVIDYFANGAACPTQYVTGAAANGNGELTGLTLTANEAAALNAVGITLVEPMVASASGYDVPPLSPVAGFPTGSFDPTFSYYTSATALPPTTTANVVSGGTLAGLDPLTGPGLARIQALGLPTTGRYVALGVGPRCTMVGKTMQAAPVHFGDQPVLNPEYGYERMVALFKVSDTAATAFSQAQLVGVAPVHDNGLGSVSDELQNWYQITAGGS